MTSNTIDLTAPNHYPPTNGSGYPYQNGNGFSGYTPPSSQDLTSTGLRNQFQYGSKPYYGTERSGSGFGNKGFNRETDPNYDRYGNNSRDSFREKGRESRDFQGTRETTYNRDYQRDYNNRDYSRENRDFGRGERDYNGRDNRDYNRDNNRDYNRDSYRNNNRGESRKYRFEDNDRKKFDDVGNDFGYKEDGLCEANPRLEKYLFEDNDGDKLIGEEPVLNFDSYNDIPVTVDGSPAKSNINTFEDLNLGVVLNSNIKLSKFKTPTPIQKFSIPIALSGKDLMACAQTGSGKTAAFLFPMIARIIQNRKQYHDEISSITRSTTVYPLALILAPTRELAIQIHVVAKKFCYRSHLRPVVVYGGHNFSKQAMEITNGCHILVATPGRLIDMIEKKIISVQCIKFLCFDEADRMLDMGFEEQMRKIVFNMGMPDKYRRQTSMFSATFPDSIRQMAKDFLNSYAFIAIGRIGSTTDLVKQHIKFVEENDKKQELLKLLKNIDGRVLVFSATKKSTDHLGYFLCQMGLAATSIHGDRSQTERENALRDFKSDRARILVATDVAARGLHIENVIHVINYDLPSNVEDYVHRIGRTGRCGKQGESTSFFNSSNVNIVKDLIQLLMDNKQTVPEWILDFGRDFNNKRKTKDNRMKKGGGGGYQKDWRRYNNYGNNNLYTGPKVYNFNHTNTLPERTHTGGGGPPTTYWKS